MQVRDDSWSNAIHVVYTVCGASRKAELFTSVKSLLLFTGISGKYSTYIIHILADATISETDLRILQRGVDSEIVLHRLHPDSPMLLEPCMAERLYLHEHAAFQNVERVSRSY